MGRSTQVLAEGIYFGEAPRWHGDRLWFSDFHAHAVKSVSLVGDLRTEVELDDQPSGLGWMQDGSMLIVSMNKRQVLRRWPDATLTIHAELTGARFRANDMVVDRSGTAFVGDFGFDIADALQTRGLESVVADHPTAQIASVSPDGTVRVAAEGMHFPNGSAITPDGRTLIVAETLAGALSGFDIGADGTLTNRRIWATTWPHVPDGITLNADGNIWIANAVAPECVLIAEGGAVLEMIDTAQPCFACMLGGEDGRTLFMLTAPSAAMSEPGDPPLGRLITARVDSPHAGQP